MEVRMVTTMDAAQARSFSPELAESVGSATGTPGWDLDVERRIDDGRMLADFLGWFSVGLGAAELLIPGRLERFLGVEDRAGLIRGYGVRELAAGAGILGNHRPAGWLWARVAGDVLDLATLATALAPRNRKHRNVLLAMGAVVGVTALDVLCARQLGKHHVH
jgi:hypothetical protein